MFALVQVEMRFFLLSFDEFLCSLSQFTSQMLHFIEHEPSLARKMHSISKETAGGRGITDKSWPFFCVSIGFSKEAIQAMRSGQLNKKCNNRRSVLSPVHEFHHACFGRFYRYSI